MKFHIGQGEGMTPGEMTEWLHRAAPLSAAMGVRVIRLQEGGAELTIPLRPNINHEGTVFGGSLNALGLLTAAAAALNRLRREGYKHRIVVRRSEYSYHRPAAADPVAQTEITDDQWSKLRPILEKGGKARLDVKVKVTAQGKTVGTLKAQFTLLPPKAPDLGENN